MTDIVERLRAGCAVDVTEAMYEAAAEIERLTQINADHCRAVNTLNRENSRQADEIERLRAALKQIRDTADGRIPTDIYELSSLARAALEPKP